MDVESGAGGGYLADLKSVAYRDPATDSYQESDMSQKDVINTPSELMVKPVWSWAEFWQGIIQLPETTAEEIGKGNDAPKFFLIGRRRYIRQKDALAWIDRMAEAKPYFPRRNNRLVGC